MNILKKDSNQNIQDKKVIDNLRGLAIDIIDNAKSGHPGIALGAAPIIYTLYAYHLNFSLDNDKWFDRDRFVLSAGHGSALLYAILYMAGFSISLDDLKMFRKINSITPGHPEYLVTPGVDITTGPLGQGLASSVGLAIGEEYLSNYFGKKIINHYTYVLCGDGDLMEGISYEACSIASKLALNKLIVLYDSNDVTLDGELSRSSSENMRMRFESINWNYLLVNDGEDVQEINEAINKAKNSDKPTLIEIKTTIGKFSKNQGTSKVHGSPLSEDDVLAIKNKLNLREAPFAISNDAVMTFRETIDSRCNNLYDNWLNNINELSIDKKNELDSLINYISSVKVKDIYYEIPEDNREATRVTSGKILNSIADNYPFIIGGSADVSNSTYAVLNNYPSFTANDKEGRNINYGIREHAMGAISNGLALMGLTPFASTFLSFSDYLKPSIRLSALMNLPVIYIFTHDSITVGEDGPTHQPIEQLVMLRSIPNLDVYRPSDANEVIGTYKSILETRHPSCIILGRNKVDINSNTKINEVKKGAYILEKEHGKLEAVLISCGEEMEIAHKVQKILTERGVAIRLVSMPSIEVFNSQDTSYQEQVIPKGIDTFVIELSSSYSWYQFAKDKNHLFTIDTFGKSGNKDDLLKYFDFDYIDIANKIENLLK